MKNKTRKGFFKWVGGKPHWVYDNNGKYIMGCDPCSRKESRGHRILVDEVGKLDSRESVKDRYNDAVRHVSNMSNEAFFPAKIFLWAIVSAILFVGGVLAFLFL